MKIGGYQIKLSKDGKDRINGVEVKVPKTKPGKWYNLLPVDEWIEKHRVKKKKKSESEDDKKVRELLYEQNRITKHIDKFKLPDDLK